MQPHSETHLDARSSPNNQRDYYALFLKSFLLLSVVVNVGWIMFLLVGTLSLVGLL